jgi:hypothetical protein
MKRHLGVLCCILSVLSLTIISWKPASAIRSNVRPDKPFSARELFEKYIDNVYESAHLGDSGLSFDVFKKALTGFINLKSKEKVAQNSSVLTVVDYAKSSREKRMWIIDVLNKSLILHTWVAHGHGSGNEIAKRFSNKIDSHQSSLGFYVTDDVYYGDNGRSLRLNGLDEGFNSNARKRAIVVHAAPYVGPDMVELEGRVGRSFGCPAVAPDVADEVIDTIKDGTVMFINGRSRRYHSRYLDASVAANYVVNEGSAYTASL